MTTTGRSATRRGFLASSVAATLAGSQAVRVKAQDGTPGPGDAVVLPEPDEPFTGNLGETISDSEAMRPSLRTPPPGAPNVVIVILDDVGFGATSTFGGPVPTPRLDALAAEGLRYNQFHTTALCSPTRAALLTGRNHHSVHMGAIAEIATGFPGYDSVIPESKATVAETLKLNGYNTGWFGKGHITPAWELGPAGPYDHWPTGLGFERAYFFLGGEASQFEPALFDQITPVEPYHGREDYHLTTDLVDQAITWIRNQKASAPDKPFFMYFAPGATHAPHQAPQEWIDRFSGQFAQGWDTLREEIYQRQLDQGVIPAGTALTPRPEQIPSWDEYDDRYKPVAERLMEVYAGFLAHTDDQIGRLADGIREIDAWDNTLFFYIVGDNGASAEGTLNGAWSNPALQNGIAEDPEWLLEHIDDFGTARCENHYNVGWAWALDAPFQWTKQVASHFGGTRNAMVVTWPDGIKEPGGLRSQFHHVIDIVPTILEAAGIAAPDIVNGTPQEPIEGTSMLYSLDDAAAPSRNTTQYFEILGNRAMYHDGWIASCFHGRLPWVRTQSLPFGSPPETWELYNIAEDFSQSVDVAARFPEKLAELQQRFDEEARKYNVYPLDDNTTARSLPENRPSLIEGKSSFTYLTGNVRLPELAIVNVKNTSFDLTADLEIPDGGAEGVIVCQGGNLAGWSLYVQDGKPTYFYNWVGHEMYSVSSPDPLPSGPVKLKLAFAYDGGGLGKGGTATLFVNDAEVATGRIEQTVPFIFSMSGESFDVGVDKGAAVGPYPLEFPFTGSIKRITIDLLDERTESDQAAMMRGWARAALVSQ